MLLALQILNMSVYSSGYFIKVKNGHGHHVSVFNQIDSFLEYVVEVTFGKINAFPEDGSGHHQHPVKHMVKAAKFFDFTYQEIPVFDIQILSDRLSVSYPGYRNQYDYLYYKEINPPPPRRI